MGSCDVGCSPVHDAIAVEVIESLNYLSGVVTARLVT